MITFSKAVILMMWLDWIGIGADAHFGASSLHFGNWSRLASVLMHFGMEGLTDEVVSFLSTIALAGRFWTTWSQMKAKFGHGGGGHSG